MMSWEADEWRSALTEAKYSPECDNGCHKMVRESGGGGTCLACGITVTRDEV